MKTSYRLLAAACGAAVLALQASAAPLDLDTARTLALRRAPQLSALDSASQAQEQDAIAAGQWPDPQLRFGEEKLPIATLRANDQTMDVIGIEQRVPGGRKTELAAQSGRLGAEKMRRDGELMRLTLSRDAAQAWLDAVYPRAQLKLLARQLGELDRRAGAQRLALAAGRAGLVDSELVARTRLLLEDRIAATRADQVRADAQAERWFGTVDLPDSLPHQAPPPSLLALESRLARHPAIQTRDVGIAIAAKAAELAREAKKPDWDVELSYGRARTPGMPNTLTALVSFNLPILSVRRQDRQYQARTLDAAAAEAEREAAWRELRAGLLAAYADWKSLDSRLALLEPGLNARSARLVDTRLAAYASGAGALAQVQEARENAIDDAMKLLEMRYQRERARLALDYFDPAGNDR
ncbi:TolC family protein [Paludibacterium yongneupense]|uniref:TolC family protein n=1 Tax=Paludibacterium yongneupense TaxID=400061 RepID=UPI0004061D8A|nr:TolC family protein [Paludibacterium yongneupense]